MQEPIEIYSLIQPLIKKEISDALKKYDQDSLFKVNDIPIHSHNGVDSSIIDFTNISGLPVIASVPTDSPDNGTIRLYDTGGVRRLYAFIAGSWYYTLLT